MCIRDSLYTKNGDCLFVMKGIDSGAENTLLSNATEYAREYGSMVLEYYGAHVFSAVADELEGILGKMETVHGSVSAAFSSCTTVTLAGHSFGGSQLELLAYLATLADDPRGIGMQPVHSYAFMPTPVFFGSSPTNPMAADGCYPTTAYYTSVPPSLTGLSAEVVDVSRFHRYH